LRGCVGVLAWVRVVRRGMPWDGIVCVTTTYLVCRFRRAANRSCVLVVLCTASSSIRLNSVYLHTLLGPTGWAFWWHYLACRHVRAADQRAVLRPRATPRTHPLPPPRALPRPTATATTMLPPTTPHHAYSDSHPPASCWRGGLYIIRAGRCVRRACVCERVCQRASVHLSCVRELARASWCVRVYESARLRRRVSLCQSVMRCSQCLLRVAWPGLDHHAQAADSTEPSLVHHRMTVHAKQAGTRHQVARHVWLGLWCAFARSLPPPHEGDDFDSADSDSDHGPSARPASLCKTRRKWNRYSARAWRQGAGWFLASTELVVNIMCTSINTSMGPRHLLPLSNDGTTAPSQNHRHVAFIQ
jgi:hypothetical protein